MKIKLSNSLALLAIVTVAATASAGERERSLVLHEQRFPELHCPPEHPETRTKIERFIQAEHMGGTLRKLFGDEVPSSVDDLSLLTDADHPFACDHFDRLYGTLINQKGRLFDGAVAEYWHNVAFYEGGAFFFAVVTGGYLRQEDPQNPGEFRIGSSGVTEGQVFIKPDFTPVPWQFLSDPDLCKMEPRNYHLLANQFVSEICAAESDM